MYKDPRKRFTVKPAAEVEREIAAAARRGPAARRVFLADGDAMVLSTRRLMAILAAIGRHLPRIERVAKGETFAAPAHLGKLVIELCPQGQGDRAGGDDLVDARPA